MACWFFLKYYAECGARGTWCDWVVQNQRGRSNSGQVPNKVTQHFYKNLALSNLQMLESYWLIQMIFQLLPCWFCKQAYTRVYSGLEFL